MSDKLLEKRLEKLRCDINQLLFEFDTEIPAQGLGMNLGSETWAIACRVSDEVCRWKKLDVDVGDGRLWDLEWRVGPSEQRPKCESR